MTSARARLRDPWGEAASEASAQACRGTRLITETPHLVGVELGAVGEREGGGVWPTRRGLEPGRDFGEDEQEDGTIRVRVFGQQPEEPAVVPRAVGLGAQARQDVRGRVGV